MVTSELHIAAQYLAAAAISFLPKKEDDSHTNLGWDSGSASLTTRPLNEEGIMLALNHQNFRIELRRLNRVLASKPLSLATHGEFIDWLKEVFVDLEFPSNYRFDLHYNLEYPDFTPGYTFPYMDKSALKADTIARSKGIRVLTHFALENESISEIRTWPHHFDTGALIKLTDEDSIGIGLAMPDEKVNDYYFYVSGYRGHESVPVNELPKLSHGEWISGEWNGAVLKISGVDESEASEFLNQAVEHVKSSFELIE